MTDAEPGAGSGQAPSEEALPDPEEKRGTIVEHLDELRTRIINSLIAVALGWVIGYAVEPFVYEALAAPLLEYAKHGKGVEIVFSNFAAPFFLRFQLGLVMGLVLVAPFLALQVWGFVAPGLTRGERRIVRTIAPISVVLFFLGVALAWYVLPAAFKFFLRFLEDFADAKLYQDPKAYVFFVVKMFIAFGAGFQLPVLLVGLARLGVITEEIVWRYWRHALVGIAFASMILTPSGDAFSMMVLFIPLSLLYFGSGGVIRLLSVRDRRRAARAALTAQQ
ncbi:MAG: twin-arginine translocase subunit TatC [Fimbriimonadia bacterium]